MKECFFAHGLLYMYSSAKQIMMPYNSFHYFSVFISVVVKHLQKQMELSMKQ